jgi:hypothetical protein
MPFPRTRAVYAQAGIDSNARVGTNHSECESLAAIDVSLSTGGRGPSSSFTLPSVQDAPLARP